MAMRFSGFGNDFHLARRAMSVFCQLKPKAAKPKASKADALDHLIPERAVDLEWC